MPLSVATSGLLSAGIGGLFSAFGARRRNKLQIQMAREQMQFQERMSSTAHQREVADLRAAGLNPILSATGGRGAAAPPGAQANIQDELTPAISTALSARRSRAEVNLIQDQAHSARTQAAANDMNAGRLKAEATRINLETRIRSLDESIYAQYPYMRLMQMGTAGAAVGSASALGLLKILKGFKKPPPSTLFKRGKPFTAPGRDRGRQYPTLRRYNQ